MSSEEQKEVQHPVTELASQDRPRGQTMVKIWKREAGTSSFRFGYKELVYLIA